MPTEDLRHDQVFLGRQEELYDLTHNLLRGRHTLLVGEKGIGKSRLMLEARKALLGQNHEIELARSLIARHRQHLHHRMRPDQYRILFIAHPSPMGDCLREFAEQLHALGDLRIASEEERQDWLIVKKRLAGLGSVKIQSLILESISQSEKKYLIFFDNLDRISPSQQAFLETMLTIAVTCAAVVQMKDQYMYKRIWSSFVRIELGPMPESIAAALIDHFLKNYELQVSDPQLYRREVLKAANGNPFLIKNIMWHTSRETHVEMNDIRGLRRQEDGPFFNMGPIYIFAASMFTIFKIFSLGTNNPEFYIYFSALGFLVYLTFRIFRTFFLFRPQKQK